MEVYLLVRKRERGKERKRERGKRGKEKRTPILHSGTGRHAWVTASVLILQSI